MCEMNTIGLFIARTAVTAWVGAAILFVIVSIREITFDGFDNVIKDQLVALRFPIYYGCGFVLMSLGLIGAMMSADERQLPSKRRWIAVITLILAISIFGGDYSVIYDRLMTLITPPGQTRTPEFTTLHKLSMWVNLVQLVLCQIAMITLNWPAKAAGTSGQFESASATSVR